MSWLESKEYRLSHIVYLTIWINATALIAAPTLQQGAAHGIAATIFALLGDYAHYKFVGETE